MVSTQPRPTVPSSLLPQSNHYLSSKLFLCTTVTLHCLFVEYCDALNFVVNSIRTCTRAPPINIFNNCHFRFLAFDYSTILSRDHHSVTHEQRRSGSSCQTVSSSSSNSSTCSSSSSSSRSSGTACKLIGASCFQTYKS